MTDSIPEDLRTDDKRDREAEAWLMLQHTPDWYVGDASDKEWERAYAAVDALGERANL